MDRLLIPLTDKEFKNKVSISFKNINEGFDNYESLTLSGEEKNLQTFVEELYKINGAENSYVDFYYENLKDDSKKKVYELLDNKERELLTRYIKENNMKTIYFRLTEDSIPLMVKLCTREILFSTFYFTKYPITIWGNYDKKFPCFYEGEEELQKYKELAFYCGVLLK